MLAAVVALALQCGHPAPHDDTEPEAFEQWLDTHPDGVCEVEG